MLGAAGIEKIAETEIITVLLTNTLPVTEPLFEGINVEVTQLDAHEVVVDDIVPGNVAVTEQDTVTSPELVGL